MKKLRALDLFCGAGGASMGLHRAGFEVVGVDIKPQPNYPFEFHHADVRTFRGLRRFDFIWAGPPCQKYTRAQRIRKNEHPDLVDFTRTKIKVTGIPYCIENVVGAPLLNPVELCGAMFGLRVYRHRLFECSFAVEPPQHPEHVSPIRKMGRRPLPHEFMHVVGNFSGVAQARSAMAIDWMTRDELREAIPPAYSEYIGRAARWHILNSPILQARAG